MKTGIPMNAGFIFYFQYVQCFFMNRIHYVVKY